MEFFLIYLYTAAASLANVMIAILIVMGIVGGAAAIVFTFSLTDTDPELERFREFCKQHWKPPLWISVAMILFIVAVPAKKDLAWILGGGITWKVAQSEEVQKLPENTAKAVNHFLESVHGKQAEQGNE